MSRWSVKCVCFKNKDYFGLGLHLHRTCSKIGKLHGVAYDIVYCAYVPNFLAINGAGKTTNFWAWVVLYLSKRRLRPLRPEILWIDAWFLASCCPFCRSNLTTRSHRAIRVRLCEFNAQWRWIQTQRPTELHEYTGWAKKPDCFLSVCNSRICWHTIAFYIPNCSVFYPE